MDLSKKNIKKIIAIITFAILLFTASQNLSVVGEVLAKIITVFAPVTVGLCLAFIMNIPMKILEEKVFARLSESRHKTVRKLLRPCSLITTIILFIGFIAALVLIVVPQLKDAVMMLIEKFPSYYDNTVGWIQKVVTRFNLDVNLEFLQNPRFDFAKISEMAQKIIPDGSANSLINNAFSFTSSLVVGITNTVLGAVIAVYVLAEKEKICAFVGKIAREIMPEKTYAKTEHICSIAGNSFSSFIAGQFTDSLVLGIMCFIGMAIFNIPYAAIVSVIIGVFALIPVIGPIIGEVLGCFLIFMESPASALFFLIYILVLQAIDNNFIYPKIVGKSVGLPGILVLVSVILGGNIGGILGILIGVPTASACYALVVNYFEEKEAKRKEVKTTVDNDK